MVVDLQMKLGDSGVAFFVEEVEENVGDVIVCCGCTV